MIQIYICSFGDYDLACGAANSVRKFSSDNVYVNLIDMSKTIDFGPFDNIIHQDGMRWMGWVIAKQYYKNFIELALCIDDDVRLVSKISISDRYNNNCKPINGNMLLVWKNSNSIFKNQYKILSCYRANSNVHNSFINKHLYDLCIKSNAEIIDDVWVHIDKGYEKRNSNRQNLINFIDRSL